MRIVIMGVSGSGKSSVGAALSRRIGVPYLDGDDFHPPSNIDKMERGIPLTDEDRWPWLDIVARELRQRAPVIIGCSALKRAYRDRLRAGAGGTVLFVHLTGPRALIADRMSHRSGHFMPPSLLDSQYAALEQPGPDEQAVDIDITDPPEILADRIADWLQTAPV